MVDGVILDLACFAWLLLLLLAVAGASCPPNILAFQFFVCENNNSKILRFPGAPKSPLQT